MEKAAALQISSHPLFSILTTFFLLNLLYLPNLLSLLFSPVLIATSLILTTLVHFGSQKPEPPPKDDIDPIQTQPESRHATPRAELEQKTSEIFCCGDTFFELGRRRGPLEVIYEDYEGECDSPEEYPGMMMMKSAAKRSGGYFGYCSSTDSDADSDESESDTSSFRWGDEDEEGMIEIALEEDSLIEIDLSASLQVK